MPGDIIGLGILKRLGQPSRGLPIWSICTIASRRATAASCHSGYLSVLSFSCRCAGGASTICLRHKEPASTPTTVSDRQHWRIWASCVQIHLPLLYSSSFSQLSFIPFADNFFSANVFYAQSRFLSAMPHISSEETKENPFETKI